MSLVTRTAASNFLPSAQIILQQVGSPHAQNPSAAINPDLDEKLLAHILRQPVSAVASRRNLPLPEIGFVDSFGSAVRTDEIEIRRRRFGPKALATSPHARAIWSLKMVPCCTEHWEYLVDTCKCGLVQRWQKAFYLDRCDACGASLKNAPTTQVDPALRDGLAFLIGLQDPDQARSREARKQLPTALADWDGGMVYQLALSIMPTTRQGYTPRRGHEPPAADVEKFATALAEAADVVRGWPNALIATLTERLKERAVSKRNVRYKGPLHYLPGLASELLPAVIGGAFGEALAPITALPGETPPDQIGMREASRLTGLEEYTLATARRADQLETRMCLRANRFLPMLDRREVETLVDFLKNRVGAERASYQLHLPQYAIAQLETEELIKLNDQPNIAARFGGQQVHKAELARFRQRLRDQAKPRDSINDPVPLHRVARAFGGGPKPWGMIFRYLLEGKIPFSIRGDAIDQIAIPAQAKAQICTMAPAPSPHGATQGLSQRDAAEILNLSMRDLGILPTAGKRSGTHRIDWLKVSRLAETRVSLAELSARTGWNSLRLQARLEKDGCWRRDAFGWERGQALAIIAKY
jgi:hypothetical protein